MAVCGNCGAEIKPGKKFCIQCGTAVIVATLGVAGPTDAAEQLALGNQSEKGIRG